MTAPDAITPSENSAALPGRRPRRWLYALGAAVVASSALVAVTLHWLQERSEMKADAVKSLRAIGDLKLEEIVHWRAERIADGRFFSRAPFVVKDLQALLADPQAQPARADALRWLALLKGGERYEHVRIFRPDHTELISVGSDGSRALPPRPEVIAAAFAAREPQLTDLHRDGAGTIHLDVLVPVFALPEGAAGPSPSAQPIAAMVLRVDPRQFLFPLIQRWPLPSATAETVLAHREGNEVVFLNELRHRPNTSLDVRFPIDAPDLPMAIAIRGHTGSIEGRDYRGIPVLAVTMAVPDSPWFMAAKIDQSEIYTPLRRQSLYAGGIGVTLALAIIGGAGWLWRREESAYLHRELANESMRLETEAKYRHYIEDAPLAIAVMDAKGRFVEVNPATCTMTGFSQSELIGRVFTDIFEAESREAVARDFETTRQTGYGSNEALFIRRKDGEIRQVNGTAVRLSEDQFLVFSRDVTAQRHAEEQLRENQLRLAGLVDSAMDAIITIDEEHRIVLFNPAAERMFRTTAAEMLGQSLSALLPERFRAAHPGHVRSFGASGVTQRGMGSLDPLTCRRADGSEFPAEVSISKVTVQSRRYFTAILRDISERMRAEQTLRESEQRLRTLGDNIPGGAIYQLVVPPHGTPHYSYMSASIEKIFGMSAERVLADPNAFWALIDQDDRARIDRAQLESARTMTLFDQEFRQRTATGEVRWMHARSTPRRMDDGTIMWDGVVADITERKRAEEKLRRSELLNRSLVEHLPQRIFIKDLNSVYLSCNAAYARDLGIRKDEIVGKDDFAFFPRELAEQYRADDQAVISANARKDIEEEYSIDGKELWIHTTKVPYHDEQGRVVGVLGIFEDLTERRQLEMQFRQAQKMEAIGQLAGGVAHDFNNILSVITVHTDLLMATLPDEDPTRESLVEVQRAADRAAALTRQLLVFSRQQVVEPKVIDLNAQVTDSQKMLCRLIGEDVRLESALAPDLAAVKMDPGQLGQVIMNFAVNARDAMPEGGQLTIETQNVELDEAYARTHSESKAGPHVLLAISDTGCGMSAEVLAHIWEPFFTTKGIGRGTGLGLAVVHGIVKQAGGHLGVYSEPGAGTTFKVYLPALPTQALPTSALKKAEAVRGSETILLVDDEDPFRRITASALEHLGYRVLAANCGRQAIELAAANGNAIDLLLTDVVMPEMGGRALAEQLRTQVPGIKVLYQSGYTDDAVVRHGILHAEVAFLQKPFTLAALAAKVREVLDA